MRSIKNLIQNNFNMELQLKYKGSDYATQPKSYTGTDGYRRGNVFIHNYQWTRRNNKQYYCCEKSWVEVEVKARNSRGTILQADRIDCKITNSKGKIVFLSRYNVKGIFPFKPRKRGKYSLKLNFLKRATSLPPFKQSLRRDKVRLIAPTSGSPPTTFQRVLFFKGWSIIIHLRIDVSA